MSSEEQQTVMLEFKISDSSLTKLQDIMSGGGASNGGGGGSSNVITRLQQSMNKSGIGALAKLSGIAIGVTGVVALVKKLTSLMIDSSPMLKSMLKLFQTGIMFILRPIGDFIGFLLRPIMIYLLRTIFIPWYRQMAPLMRLWGAELGANLVEFIKDPFGKLGEWWASIDWGRLLSSMGGWFTGLGIITLLTAIRDFASRFNVDLGQIASGVSTRVKAFFDSIATTLTSWWDGAMGSLGTFTAWMSNSIGAIGNIVGGAWNNFVGYFKDRFGNISSWVNSAWSNFIVWITGNLGIIGTWLGTAWNNFTGFFTNIIGQIWNRLGSAWNNFLSFFQSIGYIWNLLGTAWNNFITFIQQLGDLISKFDITKSLSSGVSAIGNTFNNLVNNSGANNTFSGTLNNYFSSAVEDPWKSIFGMLQDSTSRRGQ